MPSKWYKLPIFPVIRKNKRDKPFIKEPKRDIERIENAVAEVSPAHTMLDLIDEMVSPPEVYQPTIDYNQKNDLTPLPVGNLQTFFKDLSIQAAIAWRNWTQTLEVSIDDLMLTEEEKLLRLRYQRITNIENKKWLNEQEEKVKRVISETPNFKQVKIPKLERYKYSPSHEERARSIYLTNFETNIARKNSLNNQDHLIPNCTFRDDPDYIAPSNSNRSFNVIKPAARIYNSVYAVYRKDGKVDKLFPNKYKGKDYTTQKDIVYMYKTKGIDIATDLSGDPKIESLLKNETFEYDLRVSKGQNPDPRNYKKIDVQSNIGLKLMQLLDEQPYLWVEKSWPYEENNRASIKVTFSYTVPHNVYDFITFWVYMDDKFVKTSNLVIPKKKILPHIRYNNIRCSVWGDRDIYQKLSCEMVYHRSFKSLANDLFDNVLLGKYNLVKESTDIFNVSIDYFVRNDALYKKDRDKFLLCKSDWEKKYTP